MFYWGLFLQKPEARDDPQFKLISGLYQQVKEKTEAAGKPQQPSAASNKNAQQQVDTAGNIIH